MSHKRLREFQKKERLYDSVTKVMQTPRFQWTNPFSRRAIVFGLFFVPMMFSLCFMKALTLTLSAFLGEARTKAKKREISRNFAYRINMRELSQEKAVVTLVLVCHGSLGANIFFM